ncbi:MAG: helix-turn-helix domain-containing protein [Pseudomonadota bacterium]
MRLTDAQQRVLNVLDQLLKNNQTPTLEKMATILQIDKSGVHQHLKRLKQKGIVTWEAGRAGTLRRVPPGIPIRGTIE